MADEINIIVEDELTLSDIESIKAYINEDMTLTMYRATALLKSAIVQYWPVGATNLSSGAWGTAVQKGVNVVKGIVSNPLDYAGWVDKGRDAGRWPPVAPIELWVRRVLQVPEADVKNVTFLVRRAIGRRGTKGANAVQKGIDATKGIIQADFQAVPDRVKARIDAL